MAFDSITEAEVDTNSPITPELMKKFKNRDEWNWVDGDKTYVDPDDCDANYKELITKMRQDASSGHRHRGTGFAGDGPKIGASGIATGSVASSNLQDDSFVPGDFTNPWITGDHLKQSFDTPDTDAIDKTKFGAAIGPISGTILTDQMEQTTNHGDGSNWHLAALVDNEDPDGDKFCYIKSLQSTGVTVRRWGQAGNHFPATPPYGTISYKVVFR